MNDSTLAHIWSRKRRILQKTTGRIAVKESGKAAGIRLEMREIPKFLDRGPRFAVTLRAAYLSTCRVSAVLARANAGSTCDADVYQDADVDRVGWRVTIDSENGLTAKMVVHR